MSQEMTWKDVRSQDAKTPKGAINNLRLESGKTYELRFLGSPIKFHKYFIAGKSAICENPDDCIIKKKYNQDPGLRYAINVIDRADKQLKVLEVPPSVLKPVAAWAERRKQDPGGDNGCDFSVTVTGIKKQTRYEVVPLDITPLTEEEKKLKEQSYDLKKLFKPTPADQIEAKLFGGAQTTSQSTAQAQAQPVAAGTGENKGVELPF